MLFQEFNSSIMDHLLILLLKMINRIDAEVVRSRGSSGGYEL